MSKNANTAYDYAGTGYVRRQRAFYTVRLWSVRHARFLEWVYDHLADIFLKLHPVWRFFGYRRVEAPVKAVERIAKSFLFDCRMCGQCVLGSTGMSCPMNCPKGLRNGPCGGVRGNGHCEVEPDMPCVWVEAWKGAAQMRKSDAIVAVQKPLDHSLRGTSSWLRATAQSAERDRVRQAGGAANDPGRDADQ